MGGEFGGALGEEDTELAGGAAEEADQHGGPPRAEQQLGRRRGRVGRGGRRGGVRGGARAVEPEALDERLDVGAGCLHGRWDGGSVDMESFGTWVCAVVYSVDGLHL